MNQKTRRIIGVFILVIAACVGVFFSNSPSPEQVQGEQTIITDGKNALATLNTILVKGRASKTGYTRDQFGEGWNKVNGCDVRNLVLKRDLKDIKFAEDGCKVESGVLEDVYSGQTLQFTRGEETSQLIQIDHVVALSDAWQKGAQNISSQKRNELANDSLNLIAVEGRLNQQKSDSDAASWLPPDKNYRCAYVARQIAVKIKYGLWVTSAEHDAMTEILKTCPQQVLPIESG